jgi:DNA repair exonuclease SbcCD ATPase subunit
MPIIDAMSSAQIQMIRHLLQEMEAEGVFDLSQARQRLQREEEIRRRELRLLSPRRNSAATSRSVVEPCPSCGKPLSYVLADGELVAACRVCRWSAIVEG